MVRCSTASAFFSFAAFWLRSNAEFVVWSVISSVLEVVLWGAGGVMASLVKILAPVIFSGIDFLILLAGRARWALGLFRVFFVLNLCVNGLSLAIAISRRNACVPDNFAGAMTVVAVAFNVAHAGWLLAVIKIFFRKSRRVFPPALRYGISSHVLISLPRPGDKAALVMSDGDVVLAPAMPGDEAVVAPGQRTVHFTAPSSRFLSLVSLWGVVGVLWVVAAIISTGLEAAALRARPLERCWETRPPSKAHPIVTTCVAALAATLLIAILAIIISHGLGRVLGSWIGYWYRRNWVLVAASFLRGFGFLREEFPVSFWISSVVTNSIFMCFALATFDLTILIAPAKTPKIMFWLFIVAQLFYAIVVYLTGSSLDNPCDRSKLSPSATWFVINKIQASVFLFHSIYFLQMLFRVKLLEGVSVPIINFSSERFSERGKRPIGVML